MTAEEKEFIKENMAADVNRLLLNPPALFKSNIKFLAEQIQSRQKAKGKLPSWGENYDLIMPPPLSIEQCSSEETADYKGGLVKGDVLVDLTGGMGVDCLALSRSFSRTIYVEQQLELCERFRQNSDVFGCKIEVVNQSAEEFLKDLKEENVTFFIDPARRDPNAKRVFKFSECSPNVVELMPYFKKKALKVLIKASPLVDLKQGLSELQSVAEIHVVSVKNDCKEVLFLLDFEREVQEPVIKTVNFSSERETFDFKLSAEESAGATLGDLDKYLLIPNASILKAGAFKKIGQVFGLKKLAANTHLYTSNSRVPKFPGRQFEVIAEKVDKKILQVNGVEKQVNVITRNHPNSALEILKKYKLKEGGELYIIGFRDQRNKPQLTLVETMN